MPKKSDQTKKEYGWNEIGREWGKYLKRNIQYEKADQYFKKALRKDPKQTQALLESSRCKLQQCKTEDALDDVKRCLDLDAKDVKSRHQHAKCLFNSNEFETAFSVAHSIATDVPTNMDVRHTKDALEMSLRKAFCPSAVPVLRKYKLHLHRESNEMDEKKPPPSPILDERQKAIELMKHRLYFDTTFAEQLDFWQKVKKDKTLDSDTHEIIDRMIKNLYTHENMLYTREPFYAKRDKFDRGSLIKAKRSAFYYAQEETRREAVWQLRNIKKLAATDFAASLELVERVLSEFYAIKRRTIFPAKYEFMCQIIYFVGSQYLKIYRQVICELMSLPIKDRLMALFNVWGPMLHGEDLCDKKSKYFLKRLDHAVYDIEMVYIYHQLSEWCFRFRRPEESQRYARDAITYAIKCNSNIWKFLGYYNVVRVDAMKQNYHPMKENLNEMHRVAEELDSFAQVFVNVAIRSLEDIKSKKK